MDKEIYMDDIIAEEEFQAREDEDIQESFIDKYFPMVHDLIEDDDSHCYP